MKPVVVQPLYLADGALVHVVHQSLAEQGEFIAAAQLLDLAKREYNILINDARCREMYEQSWGAALRAFTYEDFVLGLYLHEMSHVRWHSLELTQQQLGRIPLFLLIDNILEDRRIEHLTVREFPGFSDYLHASLSTVRRDYDIRAALKVAETSAAQDMLFRLKTKVNQLFVLARFGVRLPEMDRDFFAFALPHMLSAGRNDRANALLAASMVYHYLVESEAETSSDKRLLETAGSEEQVAISREEMQGQLRAPSVAGSGVRSFVKAAEDAVREQEEHKKHGRPGKGAGDHDTHVVIADQGNAFARKVLEDYQDNIRSMNAAFRLLFEGLFWVDAYEGDLPPRKQVAAYLHSLWGDEELDYIQLRKRVPSANLVVLGDVSGSTSSYREEYATVKVKLLASLEGIDGILSGAVDFSDDATWVKHFREPLALSRVEPRVVGGTKLVSGLDTLWEEEYTQEERWAFVVTDGDWVDHAAAEREVVKLMAAGFQFTFVHITRGDADVSLRRENQIAGYPLYQCGVSRLPDLVYQEVLSRLQRRAD